MAEGVNLTGCVAGVCGTWIADVCLSMDSGPMALSGVMTLHLEFTATCAVRAEQSSYLEQELCNANPEGRSLTQKTPPKLSWWG